MIEPNRRTHAHDLLAHVAANFGSGVGAAPDLPEGLRAVLMPIYDAFQSGRSNTCTHSPDPASGQTVLAAAWRPDLVVCRHCSYFLIDRPEPARDVVCDGCGKRAAGHGPAEQTWLAMVQLRHMLIQVDLCGACLPNTVPVQQEPLTRRIRYRGRRGRGRGKGGRT